VGTTLTFTAGLQVIYWCAVVAAVYPYVVYPALLALWARARPRPVRRARRGDPLPTVSVVIAVRNEEAAVARRVREFARRIADEGLIGEIVVVSDGSTDGTARAAWGIDTGDVPVKVIELTENVGKAVALSIGCDAALSQVIAFADARQTWADDALRRLLENFADPEVGAVSGELFVESAPGVMAGVGLYWRYEKAIRRNESLVHSTVGVTGAIAAVRRSLFRTIPAGTILDDVYWPLRVAMRGNRVVFDGRAHAFDRLPDEVSAELKRKVRTLTGNFQLIARLPEALVPWRNPVWFPWVSHKLMRLVVPWAFLATGVLPLVIAETFYYRLFGIQAALTLLGLAGLAPWVAARSRTASVVGSFLVLNAAAFLAFWVWASGRASRSWTRTWYRPAAAAGATLEGAAR
jgi:cellulose synthase/poly-beta-1,6-N-acetylglucosamine synthase-like glycosyltransferase